MRKVLLFCLLFCGSMFSAFAGPKAQWIVYPEKTKDSIGKERYFRTEFKVPGKAISRAVVCYIIDDYGSVFLNGKTVDQASSRLSQFPGTKQFDVTKLILRGTNAIAATAVNSGAEGGFILRLTITFRDGSVQELFTDTKWKTSTLDPDGWKKTGFNAKGWVTPRSAGDYNAEPWATYKDMVALYAHDDAAAEMKRRHQAELRRKQVVERLAKEPKLQSKIAYKNGSAYFDIGGKLYRPVLYNSSSRVKDSPQVREKFNNFAQSDINLVAFAIESANCWKGPGEYDFSVLDKAFENACEIAPNARFVFGIIFSHGPVWWNKLHPEELIQYARTDHENPPDDNIGTYPAPSYASELWLRDASETVRKIISHIESKPYGKRVFAYRIDAGVYLEWHYYGMAESMPDVSAPMTRLFRSFLREKYQGDVNLLRKAWGQPKVTFESAVPPPREVRLQFLSGSLRDPVKHAWNIDHLQCMQRSLQTALLTLNRTAKEACDGRALIGNYCGYVFSMGYTAEGWHLVNDEFMRSPYVDFQVSPCCYSSYYRNIGSTQLSRGLTASYRLHNKINIFEADGRTSLAPQDGCKHVNTIQESVAMLSRDLAQAVSKGCAYWYYDFGRNWYNTPAILKFFRNIAPVYDSVRDFSSSADVAVIVDWESAYYHAIQAPYGGTRYYASMNYLPQELKRAGLQFDAYSFADIEHPELQKYKVYVFPQLVYMTPEKLAKLAVLKKSGKTLIFTNTPGWLTPKGPDVESIFRTTGIRADVLVNRTSTTTTKLSNGTVMDVYGGAFGRGLEYSPVLKVTDSQATILGSGKMEDGKKVPVYAKKQNSGGWVSYVSGTPVLTSPELRRIAKEAGVHVYCDSDKGVVYANESMISFHTGTPGKYTLRAKKPVKWTMVYPEKRTFMNRQSTLTFQAPKANTYIFTIEP